MKTINYESDFKIIEGFKDGSSILAAPFRFTYYTKVTRGTYVASYDGTEYVNCHSTEDGRVVIPFDSPKLGMGVLMVKREFFLSDSDFADGVCNLVSVESTGITLDKGSTDCEGEVVVELFPFYQKGDEGKSAYDLWLEQGNEGTVEEFIQSLKGEKGEAGKPFTYEDMTEEQKNDIASRIPLPIADLTYAGEIKLCSEESTDVEKVFNSLSVGGAAIGILLGTDGVSVGGIETRANVASKYRQWLNYFFTTDPIGYNVGDMLLIYKIVLNVCVLKILPINDAKARSGEYEPTAGVISGDDKARIDKIDSIEAGANDTRNWLTSVNDTVERNIKRTRYGYGTKLNDCIYTGVCAYTPDMIGRIEANWTVFVDCSADADGGGYYRFTQTAICRDEPNVGKTYRRMGYYQKDGGQINDLHFTSWETYDVEVDDAHHLTVGIDGVAKINSLRSRVGYSAIVTAHGGVVVPSLVIDGGVLVFGPESTMLYSKDGTLEEEYPIPSKPPLQETEEAPKEIPDSNTILLDTKNNVAYFGIGGKGWWKVGVKNANGSVGIEGDVLVVEGYGEVKDNLLVLDNGTVTNNTLTL